MRARSVCFLALLLAACESTVTSSVGDASDVIAPTDALTTDAVTTDAVAPDAVAPSDVIAPMDRGAPSDVVDAPAMGCTGIAPACVSGTPGGSCGDGLTISTCVGGAWRCQTGMIFVSQCACIGRPPGNCTCGPSGWICDAGAPDVSAAVDCDPTHVLCNGIPPTCSGGGEVPSVREGCWGPCVVFTRCAPIACDPDATPSRCPTNLVCYRTTRMCGPFL